MKRAEMTPDQIEMIETVAKEIIEFTKEFPCEVDGVPMAQVKYNNGNFKQKTLIAGWNFYPAYAYVGARGETIFGFSPEEVMEFEFVEFTAKNVDQTFPMLGGQITKMVRTKILELTTSVEAVGKATEDMNRAILKLRETMISESFKVNFDNLISIAAMVEIHKQSLVEHDFANDPRFGAF